LSLRSAIRKRLGGWLLQGRVRLGDGRGLTPISSGQLEAVRRHFPRQKFFIMGHARSGTTLLGRLVRLHPQLHCNWQGQFFSRRGPVPHLTAPDLLRWLHHPSNRWTAGKDFRAASIRVYCDFLMEQEAAAAGKSLVGDKSTNENGAEAMRWLAAVYPDASLVYIVRDGRDAVLSKRVQTFVDQSEFLRGEDRSIHRALLRDPRPFLEGRRSLFSRSALAEAAQRWSRDVRESVDAGRAMFAGQFQVLRYEDLLLDAASRILEVWGFLGAQPPEGDWRSRVEAEMRANPPAEWHAGSGAAFVRELPRGRHGAWKSVFTQEDRRLMEEAAGAELRRWGYEVAE
jgi:hypothetical protein